jgi:hypothetical protein
VCVLVCVCWCVCVCASPSLVTDTRNNIDFKEAFDSIYRFQIMESIKECGMPAKLISLITMTLSRTYTKVEIQNKLSKSFRI